MELELIISDGTINKFDRYLPPIRCFLSRLALSFSRRPSPHNWLQMHYSSARLVSQPMHKH